MIIPVLGFVGKKKRSISGESSNTGFKLTISEKNGGAFFFNTQNYSEFELDEEKANRLIRASSLLTLFLALIASISILAISQAQLFVSLLFLLFAIILITSSGSYIAVFWHTADWHELRQWHACEHKAVALLESGLVVTFENLKKCPKTVLYCGSSVLSIMHESVWLLWCAAAIKFQVIPISFSLWIWFWLLGVCSVLFFFVNSILWRFTKQAWFFEPFFFIFIIPMAIMPLFTEKYCTVEEPSDEKIKQTVEDIKQFFATDYLKTILK